LGTIEVFLKMNMEAGHGGSAARFERLRERTHDFAFALKIFGLTEAVPVSHGKPAQADVS
jgi:oligopeptidase B